jgi:hypothetical protein
MLRDLEGIKGGPRAFEKAGRAVAFSKNRHVEGLDQLFLVVEKSDAERDDRVLHPKSKGLRLFEDKQHPCVRGEMGSSHQPFDPRLGSVGDLHKNRLFADRDPRCGSSKKEKRKRRKKKSDCEHRGYYEKIWFKRKLLMNRLLIFLIAPTLLFARGKVVYEPIHEDLVPPWLTGPLLAPSSVVVPIGYVNIEPYIFAQAFTGQYDSDWKAEESPTLWLNFLEVLTYVGLTEWMNLVLTPTVFWNYSHHAASWQLSDLTVALDFQLYPSPPGSALPNVKLVLRENIPIGKYRNLNPEKKGTDVGGIGSWDTQFGVVFGQLYHLAHAYYFDYRLFLNYGLPAPTRLKGFNLYGGGFGTDARMFPSQHFTADLGLQLTLSQNWALAFDFVAFLAGNRHFTGKVGTAPDGSPASLSKGFLVQYSLAPAIEYNWSAYIGVIGGAWFTVGGKNAPQFTSGVIAANFYF